MLDDHVVTAVAGKKHPPFQDVVLITSLSGLTADANILINEARISAQRYQYGYLEPQPIEQLVLGICNYKQAYTQYGGGCVFGHFSI